MQVIAVKRIVMGDLHPEVEVERLRKMKSRRSMLRSRL
jgi:hypothetical protein